MVLAGFNPLQLQAAAYARRPSHAHSHPESEFSTGNTTPSASLSGRDGTRTNGFNAAIVRSSSVTAPLAASDSGPLAQARSAVPAFYTFKVKCTSDSGAPTVSNVPVTGKSSCRSAAQQKRARATAISGRPKRQWRLQPITGISSNDDCKPTPAASAHVC